MSDTGFSNATCAIVDGRSNCWCEVCGSNTFAERHHRRPRGSGGSKRTDTNLPSNCLAVCRDCHRMIESHRRIALMLGWLIGQRSNPSETRVMYRGEWSYLLDDGTVWTSIAGTKPC